MRVNYVIFFVSDMARSVAFYRDVLEIPLKFESPHWTEFATDGATLVLHAAVKPPLSANSPVADPASAGAAEEPPGTCRPGLRVPNLDEFHERMRAHQVPCLQAPRAVFGTRIAQYADPDGLAFSVGEDRAAR